MNIRPQHEHRGPGAAALMNRFSKNECSNSAARNPTAVRWWLLLLMILVTGCGATEKRVIHEAIVASIGSDEAVQLTRRKKRRASRWNSLWARPEPPSNRTAMLLRRYNLEDAYQKRPDDVIRWLDELVQNSPSLDEVHALAELAEKQASWAYQVGDRDRATQLYATAIIHAYYFLFNSDLNLARNAYDPQFRSICDIYNRSLESILREISQAEGFAQGYTTTVGEHRHEIEIEVRVEGRWQDQEFERFELVSDFDAEGFDNQYHTYGLGAPLIAVRKQQPIHLPSEQFYPPELSLPLTAFLHLVPDSSDPNRAVYGQHEHKRRRAVLSLYDPLEQTLVKTDNKVVPLESDITTPLAHGLNKPIFQKGVLATGSLLNAEFAPDYYGMFMLEPFDPEKIPVVMVHGLWSSPTTWAHMFNDLRSYPDIHSNYQFWFYSYPTAQPFWISAKQLRDNLEKVRDELDPTHSMESMDQMILVGHSMGGLVSLMQTVDSEDHFWSVVSDDSVEEFEGDRKTLEEVKKTFFFESNPSVARVITIATPMQGSRVANSALRWLGQKLIRLPSFVTGDLASINRRNSERIKDDTFLTETTSVDSLSPDNPIFDALNRSRRREDLQVHNIIGQIETKSILLGRGTPTPSDGVVELSSARDKLATSEKLVSAAHQQVHQHPACILEVSRILLQNLAEQEKISPRPLPAALMNTATTDAEQAEIHR